MLELSLTTLFKYIIDEDAFKYMSKLLLILIVDRAFGWKPCDSILSEWRVV